MARFRDAAEAFEGSVQALPGLAAGSLRFTPSLGEIATDIFLAEERTDTRDEVKQRLNELARRFSELRFALPRFHSVEKLLPSFLPHSDDDPDLYQFEGRDFGVTRVLGALANPEYDWRTVDGLSRETGLDRQTVLEILERMPARVLRSVTPDSQGRDLYAMRSRYKADRPTLQRFLDQFRSTVT